MTDTFIADLRQAASGLARAKTFTGVAVGMLGAALGLSLSVATVVNAYLVRGLPYPASDRLYSVRYGQPGPNAPRNLEALDWASLNDIVEQPIAWDLDSFSLRGAPYPELAQGTWVTPGYMEGFGIRPALGRTFTPEDFQLGRPSVAIISHRLWQSRFTGDPHIVGRQFQAHVNDRPDEVESFTIVGVLPPNLWHMNVFTEVLAPLRAPTFPYMVRLRPGADPAAAAGRITALVRGAHAALPVDWHADLLSTHGEYVRQIRPLLLSLAAATSLVMLIAAANVAVLLMVRASQRRREFAVRKALGATTGRITRAVAAEALVLGATATALGLALASVVLSALAPTMERQLGRSAPGGESAIALGAPLFLAGIGAGLLIALVCSLASYVALTRAPLTLALTGGQKGGGQDAPGQQRARSVLIAVEVACSLALLVGATLMVQSGLRILDVDMGLDVRDVQVGRLSLRPRTYTDAVSRNTFYDRLHDRIAAVRGVQGTAFTACWPLQATSPQSVAREGAGPETAVQSGACPVGLDYFTALGIRITDGRAFTRADRPGTPAVAVVSETLARTLWPGRRAVGERVSILPRPGSTDAAETFVVVGVAHDVRHTHTDNDLADLYVALSQDPPAGVFVYVRTAGAQPALERDMRQAIAAEDSELALGTPRPMADILDQQRAGSRFLAALLVVFAVLAVVLALVGIYGVIAYAVRQREREIALRMAIGADRGAIMRMFLRHGAVVVSAGLALGMGGAFALGRVLQSQLFGVESAEPEVLLLTTAAFAICSLAAVAWPALVAATTDPAAALKE